MVFFDFLLLITLASDQGDHRAGSQLKTLCPKLIIISTCLLSILIQATLPVLEVSRAANVDRNTMQACRSNSTNGLFWHDTIQMYVTPKVIQMYISESSDTNLADTNTLPPLDKLQSFER